MAFTGKTGSRVDVLPAGDKLWVKAQFNASMRTMEIPLGLAPYNFKYAQLAGWSIQNGTNTESDCLNIQMAEAVGSDGFAAVPSSGDVTINRTTVSTGSAATVDLGVFLCFVGKE